MRYRRKKLFKTLINFCTKKKPKTFEEEVQAVLSELALLKKELEAIPNKRPAHSSLLKEVESCNNISNRQWKSKNLDDSALQAIRMFIKRIDEQLIRL